MYTYPQPVDAIVRDYLDRVANQLRTVPAAERQEFLRELESHIYEGYHQPPEQEPVPRILGVLRNLGEPADVVADRLPESMVRSGTARKLPLRLLAGVLIALFGLPLGFGGVAVVAGVLVSVAAALFAYYAVTVSMLFAGSVFVAMGLMRIYRPDIWDGLVGIGAISMEGAFGDFMNQIGPGSQGLLLLLGGAAIVGIGLGLWWLGKYMLRGTRFLFAMTFDGVRRAARRVRGHSAPVATPAASPLHAPVADARPSV